MLKAYFNFYKYKKTSQFDRPVFFLTASCSGYETVCHILTLFPLCDVIINDKKYPRLEEIGLN